MKVLEFTILASILIEGLNFQSFKILLEGSDFKDFVTLIEVFHIINSMKWFLVLCIFCDVYI